MFKRSRYKQQMSMQERLMAWAGKVREQADQLQAGPEKNALLKKAGQAETAAQLDSWVNSPELRPPK